MTDNQTTANPQPGTVWRAKPTALMEVLNPGPRMRRQSEQSAGVFGTFLQKVDANV